MTDSRRDGIAAVRGAEPTQFPGSLPLDDPRYEAYCQYFHASGKKEEAAKRAGFSARSARNQASRMMKNEEVRERLDFLKQQTAAVHSQQIRAVCDRFLEAALFEGDPSRPEAAGIAHQEVQRRQLATKEGIIEVEDRRWVTPDRAKYGRALLEMGGMLPGKREGPQHGPGFGNILVQVFAPGVQPQATVPAGQMVNGVMVLTKHTDS